MIQFRDGFYSDVRTEDRSRTFISYQAGMLEEMKTRVERRAFIRVYDGKMWYYASVTDLDNLQKTVCMMPQPQTIRLPRTLLFVVLSATVIR